MTPIDGKCAGDGDRGAGAPRRIFQTLGTGVDQPCNLAKSVTVE